MGLAENIRANRDKLGMYQAELGRALGVSAQAVSKWELGKAEPDSESIMKMCRLFNVSADDLLGGEFAWKMNQDFIPIRHNAVPIVGEIACGTPIMAEQNIEGYADTPDGIKCDFALRCRGESMEPTFKDGDLVLIRQQPDVEDGQIAAVLINGDATLKHVYHEKDGLLLIADNPAFAPIHVIPVTGEFTTIQGIAVGYTRMFR